jgi:hypothetical protein
MNMKPGDLVVLSCESYLNLFLTIESIRNYQPPPHGIPSGSIGIILSPPDRGWIKWMVNEKIGWSNWAFLQKQS